MDQSPRCCLSHDDDDDDDGGVLASYEAFLTVCTQRGNLKITFSVTLYQTKTVLLHQRARYLPSKQHEGTTTCTPAPIGRGQ